MDFNLAGGRFRNVQTDDRLEATGLLACICRLNWPNQTMSDAKKRSFLRQLGLRLLATMGIVGAVLLSWWLKIEDARTPDETPQIALGQPVDMGRSRLTPISLQLRRIEGKPDQLVLFAAIENVTGETQDAVFGIPARPPELDVDGAPLIAPEIILLRDNEPLRQLQPRLSEDIAIVWTAPDPWRPTEVSIIFSKQAFKLKDNLYGQSSWLGFTPIAQLTIAPEATP